METFDQGFSSYTTQLLLPKHQMANIIISGSYNMVSRFTISAALIKYKEIKIGSIILDNFDLYVPLNPNDLVKGKKLNKKQIE